MTVEIRPDPFSKWFFLKIFWLFSIFNFKNFKFSLDNFLFQQQQKDYGEYVQARIRPKAPGGEVIRVARQDYRNSKIIVTDGDAIRISPHREVCFYFQDLLKILNIFLKKISNFPSFSVQFTKKKLELWNFFSCFVEKNYLQSNCFMVRHLPGSVPFFS